MLYRQMFKKEVPANAKRTVRGGKAYAAWTGKNKRKYMVEILTDDGGNEYVNIETSVWYARFADSAGRKVQRSTGCTDKNAAEAVLNQWKGRTEKVKAGHMRADEEHVDREGPLLIGDVLEEYRQSLERAGRSKRHVDYSVYVVNAVKTGARITRLIDLTRKVIETYLARLAETPLSERADVRNKTKGKGASARTLNMHRTLIHGFCAYAVKHGYIDANPAAHISGANVAVDRRHFRRALNDAEISRLLSVAETRPLEAFLKQAAVANVNAKTINALKARGRGRMLTYKTLLTTAARWSELRSVTVADAVLEGDAPHLVLRAAATKNKKSDTVPLTRTLAEELLSWVKDTRRFPKSPLLDMPANGLKTFLADIAAAGIERETEEGVLDCHALRHTAATRLARAGTPITVAQRILRHSDVRLTTSVYSHLGILDTTAAVEALPPLSAANAIVEEKRK